MEPSSSDKGDGDSGTTPRSGRTLSEVNAMPRSGNAGADGSSRAREPRPTEINALLGQGTSFQGKLYFEGRVCIAGAFEGEIRGEDVLVIGEGANVRGEIFVATCIVTGG